jgi:hypothetical protein|tara:strand:+ start:115 stop:384 length:270 start_codon:yes stop_codon:yes gene_type:complete
MANLQKLQSSRASVVVASDTVNIPSISSQNGKGNNGCTLYIGAGGNLRVLTVGGDDVVFTALPTGSFLPVNVLRVFNTNTTATDILALW